MRTFSKEELFFLDMHYNLPVDRTGLLPHFNFTTDEYPVPKAGSLVTLEECINNRCAEIAKLDKPCLWWSGGIDSTVIFYGLKDMGIEFECTLSNDAKEEYPSLYQEIKDGLHKGVTPVSTKVILPENREGRSFITGELGDQIIGSDRFIWGFHKLRTLEFRNKPAEEYFPIDRCGDFYKVLRVILEKQDFTIGEFTWAINFLFKFRHVVARAYNLFDLKKTEVMHFYGSDLFQRWGLQNYESNVSFDTLPNYKMSYKDYIYAHNGDEDYRINKLKILSLKDNLGKVD